MNGIGKQNTCQRFIYKIHSARLRKNKWKLTLPLSEARRNGEVISLADSQMLRWLDALNGVTDADEKAAWIKRELKFAKQRENSPANRRMIRSLYQELDALQFKQDYLCLIIDKEKDYRRACRGFSVNGIRYKRLLGTTGGIKNSTIVFVNERHVDELRRRIDNGREHGVEQVPAKFEAYRSLTCSASAPVSMPRGVAVVPDAETTFTDDIVLLDDAIGNEPSIEERTGYSVTMDASDGYGLMLPSLAERWSEELGLDYTVSGLNTRYAWEKGMVFTFDYLEFAEDVAGSYTITDAWGDEVDLRQTELILTTSMVKLWNCYESCEDYLTKSVENGYSFGITKVCPKELERERTLNYQFIQSYDLTPEEITELTEPTRQEFSDVLSEDRMRAALFLYGKNLNERNIHRLPATWSKAMLVDERVFSDPYVRNSIYAVLRHRIDEAKVGVMKIHGNYSIASGDPYLLCQSMFRMEKTGLLKAGEIYNEYWSGASSEKLVCFRAPMSTHENIRAVTPCRREDAAHWYRYMRTCTVFNAWDTSCAALNGMD